MSFRLRLRSEVTLLGSRKETQGLLVRLQLCPHRLERQQLRARQGTSLRVTFPRALRRRAKANSVAGESGHRLALSSGRSLCVLFLSALLFLTADLPVASTSSPLSLRPLCVLSQEAAASGQGADLGHFKPGQVPLWFYLSHLTCTDSALPPAPQKGLTRKCHMTQAEGARYTPGK